MNEAILAIAMNLVRALTAPAEATLLFAGDAMMHQAQIDAARVADGAYDYSGCFDAIAPIVGASDYAVVNLETPIGTHNLPDIPVSTRRHRMSMRSVRPASTYFLRPTIIPSTAATKDCCIRSPYWIRPT